MGTGGLTEEFGFVGCREFLLSVGAVELTRALRPKMPALKSMAF
jgi:hypothetical protein